MMRHYFDAELQDLNTEMRTMGHFIEVAIRSAADALRTCDVQKAHEAIAFDEQVDRKERHIEGLCIKLLLQQQPVARDLRMISAALKMITDMERIGDQAADIAEIVISLSEHKQRDGAAHLQKMADTASKIVTASVDAYVAQDADLAAKTIAQDDVIDHLFDTVKRELIEALRQFPEEGEYLCDLLLIAKYFERIGDHAQNIAEWVEYSITGRHKGVLL